MPPPGPGEIHLWLCAPGPSSQGPVPAQWWELLAPEERERARRFYFEPDRRAWSAAHAMLRDVLGGYVGCSPEELAFTFGRFGRPELAQPPGSAPLSFSLSHTRTLVALAVCGAAELGVDVEAVDERRADAEVARRYFSPDEASWVLGAEGPERAERFFAIWTLKEAYLKARGLGLSVPLSSFSFRIEVAAMLNTSFDATHPDVPSEWALALYRLQSGHQLALCARRDGPPFRLLARGWEAKGPPTTAAPLALRARSAGWA